MRSRRQLRDAVKRGARLLDEKRPGWARSRKLNLMLLDLASPDRCVLGQLYANGIGGFFTGRDKLFKEEVRLNAPPKYGFDSDESRDEYPVLEDLWRKEIQARRQRKTTVS